MASIFTKIIKGEIPCYKIAENDQFIAFLDINPNAKGHTLCIPKVEVDRIFDLDESTYIDLMRFSRNVAKALKETISCKRIGMSVVGLEVPHVHVHLIPLNEMKEMTFQHKVKLQDDDFKQLATKISANYKSTQSEK
jgi:histidine triad (HIT) family protein